MEASSCAETLSNSRRAGSGVVAPASEKEGVCPMILKPMQYIQYRASLIDTDVATVDELIDPVQHQWRTEKIQEIFLATDARAILQIRLRRSVGEDWLAWHYEKTGVYSVRSAYRALLTAKESREAAVNGGVGHSNMQNDDKWERLWKLDVIPRVRVLWSRVLKGILPDYATLTRRHVRVDSTCSVCNSASETLYHAMMDCGQAKQFWSATKDARDSSIIHTRGWRRSQ